MALSNTSRYLLTEVVEARSIVTNELTRPPFVDLRPRVAVGAADDRSVVFDGADSWAQLSYNQLGDANAWWVIADLSGIIDPFTELVELTQLRVPSVSRFNLTILPTDAGAF